MKRATTFLILAVVLINFTSAIYLCGGSVDCDQFPNEEVKVLSWEAKEITQQPQYEQVSEKPKGNAFVGLIIIGISVFTFVLGTKKAIKYFRRDNVKKK